MRCRRRTDGSPDRTGLQVSTARRAWYGVARSVALPLALAFASIAAGCGAASQVKLSEGSHEVAHSAGLGPRRLMSVAPRCTAGAESLRSARFAYAAVVPSAAVVHREPRAGSPVISRFGRLDVNGFQTVFGVVATHTSRSCKPDWYRVQLSVLPNGTTGWVRAWAVRTYRVPARIVISIRHRTLTLYRYGKRVLQVPVGVGATATPTPVGRFFVNERYVLSNDTGPFGPAALGISAHSTVLQKTWVEDGPIGVHGTNEPWSIGQAASHGCVRLDNDVMRRLFPLAPAGTPVQILG